MQILKLLIVTFLLLSTLHATSSEDELKAVVVGKFSHFIKWMDEDNYKYFVITVFKNHSFDTYLDTIYEHKRIHKKPIKIRYVDNIEEVGFTHILYVTKHSQEEQKAILDYAQENSILTISENSGFAQRGGVIQLYFISQKIHLKINNEVAKKSNLKISSSLLSIAKIVKGDN